MVFALQVFVDEVREELLEDARGVLHLPLQRRHDERGHVAPVSHGEGPLRLQGTDEGQQEVLFGQQLAEQRQGFFHVGRDLRGEKMVVRGTGWWKGGGWLERRGGCGAKKAGNNRKNETEKEVDLTRERWCKKEKKFAVKLNRRTWKKELVMLRLRCGLMSMNVRNIR